MEVDIYRLAQFYAQAPIAITGVYRSVRQPGYKHAGGFTANSGFLFVMRGKAKLTFDGTAYELQPGSMIHGGTGMFLEYEVPEGEEFEYVLVHYLVDQEEKKGCSVIDRSLLDRHYEIPLGNKPGIRLHQLLDQLERYWKRPGDFSALRIKELFYSVLNESLTIARSLAKSLEGLAEQAMDYIHDHYMEALTVRHVAERHGVNVNRLAYVFHKHLGVSPGEYLTGYRINRAKQLLRISSDKETISEIALRVGYPDPLYFSRIFKKHTGVSPSAYQKKVMNNPW